MLMVGRLLLRVYCSKSCCLRATFSNNLFFVKVWLWSYEMFLPGGLKTFSGSEQTVLQYAERFLNKRNGGKAKNTRYPFTTPEQRRFIYKKMTWERKLAFAQEINSAECEWLDVKNVLR